MAVWTADANAAHFTVDDNLYHTADGWHDDAAYNDSVGGKGGGGSSNWAGVQYPIRLLNADDEAIMLVIKEFVRLES